MDDNSIARLRMHVSRRNIVNIYDLYPEGFNEILKVLYTVLMGVANGYIDAIRLAGRITCYKSGQQVDNIPLLLANNPVVTYREQLQRLLRQDALVAGCVNHSKSHITDYEIFLVFDVTPTG